MPLRLYNTLTSRIEPFEPADPAHARLYVCGPTVYDFSHVGHARCYIIYDVLVRHLRASGMKVTFVRNITDIEDKIIARAAKNGETPQALSERFYEAYAEDMRALGNLPPDIEPKVSTHMDEIRALITKLIDKGAAYESQGDVYFRVSAFPDYGKLSHRNLANMESGASGRTEDEETARKEHPADFALWKKSDDGSATWPSPWSAGRPGWHIECSAMSCKHLGESFDLHGGGLDLVFPHHENEIAQSEAASGKQLAKHWMHNGFVETNKEKMSKSLGNFFTIRDIFKHVEPEAMRYFMLTVGYRSPLGFDWDTDEGGHVTGFPGLREAEKQLEYLYTTRERLSQIPANRIVDKVQPTTKELSDYVQRLTDALDDDLNLPVALAATLEFVSAVNGLCDRVKAKQPISTAERNFATAGFAAMDKRLGIGAQDVRTVLVAIRDRRAASRGIKPAEIDGLLLDRTAARQAKDFTRADHIRDTLMSMGVELLDTPDGTSWRVPA